MDEATRAFFRQQQEEPANQVCIDLGTAQPQWASVSHGCYLSLEASGVHRSLGVHISFVRSTTMDSWKPQQLKLMELGGNARLNDFFKKHGIPDDMPIVQKYNTRAAEWYRKNLRAEAEGEAPPAPLPEGVGHQPANDAPQIAFAQPTGAGTMSAGGALASDARLYGGYHDQAEAGFGESESASSPNRSAGALGANNRRAAPGEEDIFSAVLGTEVGTKVSSGLWSAVGAAKVWASKAKTFAEQKAEQAQTEGWVDTLAVTAKQGASVTVQATTWAAAKSVEAGKATVTYMEDGGGQKILGKTQEVVGNTAQKSAQILSTGVDWFSEQLGGHAQGGVRTASALERMSTGRMQGFGSDCPPSSQGGSQPSPSASAASSRPISGRSYHDECVEPPIPARQPADPTSATTAQAGAPATSPGARTAESAKAKADMWNDDGWGDWS